jgi:hypothetical protein
MSTGSKKTSPTWLVGMALVGAACGALIYSLAAPKEPCPSPLVGITPTAYFDKASIEAITKATDNWGGRFYLAKKDGRLSVLAAPIKESGEHIPYSGVTLQFTLYRSIVDSHTAMTPLTETEAGVAVKGASPTWSLDVESTVLLGLLEVGEANAIGLIERRTSEGKYTFELAPVKLSGGAATPEGTAVELLVGSAPCPMHCPKAPALYLHLR